MFAQRSGDIRKYPTLTFEADELSKRQMQKKLGNMRAARINECTIVSNGENYGEPMQ